MSDSAYEKVSTRKTNQREQARNDQIINNEGGFVFGVDKWTRLERFLILGSDGGSYYASPKKLTIASAKCVQECINENGPKVVDQIVAVSTEGRAPRNDPALFALAMASAAKDTKTRKLAFKALPYVARIGTHLFMFVRFAEQFRGWGRSMRNAVAAWYQDKNTPDLAYQVAKYQQRDGWSHRDLLRLSKPVPQEGSHDLVYKWVVGKYDRATDGSTLPPVLEALERIKEQPDEGMINIPRAIYEYGLTREMVPTEWLKKPETWEALLEKMPMTAMIRNLGNMSKCGLLKPLSDAEETIFDRLHDVNRLKKARIHPIALLIALKTYSQGHGMRGGGEWKTAPKVIDALNDAFYLTFGLIEPTNKRWLLGVDVSSSMGWGTIANTPLSAAEGAAAMAMTVLRTEDKCYCMGFANTFKDLRLTAKQRLDDVMDVTNSMNFGGTDCSLPMTWAYQNNVEVDVFCVLTDNETWGGGIHPYQALVKYRQRSGIDAKMIVVGMTATEFSIADPKDAGMMDVVGFDASAPTVMANFVR